MKKLKKIFVQNDKNYCTKSRNQKKKNKDLCGFTKSRKCSTHPIALSIKEKYGEKIDPKKISDVKEISGKGVKATINGEEILVGNAKLMKEYKINLPENNKNQIYVSRNNNYIGSIEVSDKIKEDSYKTVKELKKHNVKKIVMLTGDKDEVSKEVSEKLGLDEYHSELLPQDKVKIVEDLMKKLVMLKFMLYFTILNIHIMENSMMLKVQMVIL